MFIAEKESPPSLIAMFITNERSPDGRYAQTIPVVAAGCAALDGQAVAASAQAVSLVSGQTGNVVLVSGRTGNVVLVSGQAGNVVLVSCQA